MVVVARGLIFLGAIMRKPSKILTKTEAKSVAVNDEIAGLEKQIEKARKELTKLEAKLAKLRTKV